MTARYAYCRCPDCMDTVIAPNQLCAPMCDECQEYGCDGNGECLVPGAYGAEDEPPTPSFLMKEPRA